MGRKPDPRFWCSRRVLVTGHTGFKGGWVCHWLRSLGAEVHGVSVDPGSYPNLFEQANVESTLASDARIDIRDLAALTQFIDEIGPDVILHLAAQPLVIESYRQPIETISTNVIGTANVLEASRLSETVKATLVITTDKVYANNEWFYPYREIDQLGGTDPYSASKAAAEIIVGAYQRSYGGASDTQSINCATARAGNVIGGGDWSEQRLLPDILRSAASGSRLHIRNPEATRPWQHVLDPLCGYLVLLETMFATPATNSSSAWNFGPAPVRGWSVLQVVRAVEQRLNVRLNVQMDQGLQFSETQTLAVDSSKAIRALDWAPEWDTESAIERTLEWHMELIRGGDMASFTIHQIKDYEVGLDRVQ
jgi:CDP-glucose 4,6-dehydratase